MPVTRIERAFAAWARFAIAHNRSVVGVVLLVALAFTAQLPKLTLFNNVEAFLEEDDPAAITYQEFLAEFGQDQLILVALRPPNVFSEEFLGRLRALHKEIEQVVPHLESVTSLINARATRSHGDVLVVEDLLPSAPRADELEALRRRVLANPAYRDILISADGSLTLILLRPAAGSASDAAADSLGGFETTARESGEFDTLSDAETGEIVDTLDLVLARHAAEDTQVYVTGPPVIGHRLNAGMVKDLAIFLSLSILVMATILALLFRRVSGVVLPLLVVVLALLSTLGAMAWMGAPLSIVTEILPSFLIVVGICDSVHILSMVYQRLAAGDAKEDAIAAAMEHSALPVLLTSLTTAGGLLSLASAQIEPVVQLGLFAPVGVIFAWFYTVVLLPPLLSLSKLRTQDTATRTLGVRNLTAAFVRLGRFASRRPLWIVTPCAALLLASLIGAADLRVAFHPLGWFRAGDPLRVGTEAIDTSLGGSMVLELFVETPNLDDLKRPEVLDRLESLGAVAESFTIDGRPVGASVSLADLVKEIHRALHDDAPEAYSIPRTRETIAQELLVFENTGADDLSKLVNADYRRARVTLTLPRVESTLYAQLMDKETPRLDAVFGDAGSVRATGAMVIMGSTGRAIGTSIVRSMLLAFVVITPIMMLLLGSVQRGLLSMIPNVFPVALSLGLMRLFDISLDITTLLLGGIILGLAVDDTIHFMHRFQREYVKRRDVEAAVAATLESTGSALLITSLVLALGFLVFAAGSMLNIVEFGLIAAFATLVAYLADVLLAPALLSLLLRRTS